MHDQFESPGGTMTMTHKFWAHDAAQLLSGFQLLRLANQKVTDLQMARTIRKPAMPAAASLTSPLRA